MAASHLGEHRHMRSGSLNIPPQSGRSSAMMGAVPGARFDGPRSPPSESPAPTASAHSPSALSPRCTPRRPTPRTGRRRPSARRHKKQRKVWLLTSEVVCLDMTTQTHRMFLANSSARAPARPAMPAPSATTSAPPPRRCANTSQRCVGPSFSPIRAHTLPRALLPTVPEGGLVDRRRTDSACHTRGDRRAIASSVRNVPISTCYPTAAASTTARTV